VMFIDVATFLFALITLLTVRFPRPEATEEGAAGRGSLWHEAIYGWTYIKARAGLVGLLLLFVIVNFLVGTVTVLATPLVLAFASTAMLGTVLSIGGSGMLIGGLVMSIWGGLKRHIYSVFIFTMLCGFSLVLAGFRPSATLFAVAAFLFFFSLPMINAASQAIWQSKVAPDIQGRVFAVRGMIAWSSLPLAYLVAGPLADRVFEPLLVVNGPLASSFGRLIGVGPARGIGLLFMIMGSLTMLATIAGYLYPRLRLVENELPDAIAAESPTQVENEQLNRLSHPSQLEHVSE
jgi:MFS transporter, DHA3 family, macrolide efflux protein